ncbi:MAG: asparaginase [Desulfobaccales bacterium]
MQDPIAAPVLVEVTRGPAVESSHRGQVVVSDAQGNPVCLAGDPEALVCLRSLAKPFQTLAVLTGGAAAALGLAAAELALFSGSLSGQDFQTELVTATLARLGLTPAALQCGAHPPLHRPSARVLAQTGQPPSPLHNTCAGKHTAMLALCVHHGWPITDYLNPQHPVQQLILKTVAESLGLRPEEIPVAVDGCGAPVFYAPLRRIAMGYARLASAPKDSPAGTLMQAILAHPRHIAGDGRLETEVMQTLPGAIFAKSGAEGGFALSLVDGGLGVALKVEDGQQRALNPSIISILEQLGRLTPAALEVLARYRQPAILNHRKEAVGLLRPVFRLQKSP